MSKSTNFQLVNPNILFRNLNDPLFGSLTLLFVICPVVLYIILDLIHYKKTGNFRNGKFGFLSQLPLVKLAKYWGFMEELGAIVKQTKDLKALKNELASKPMTDTTLLEIKTWQLEDAMTRFSEMNLSEESSKMLEKLWKSTHKETFEGALSDEISKLIEDSKQELKKEMSLLDSKVSATKMIEIFCESGPQFVLQLSILIRKSTGPSEDAFGNLIVNNPGSAAIKILALSTSFASLLNGSFGVFKSLPYVKVGQEIPTMPQYGWRSYLVVLPCLTITIGSRMSTLSIFFGTCQPLPGAITFLIFGLVYSIVFFLLVSPKCCGLKNIADTDAYRTNQIIAFCSSVISPCVVIHPKTKSLLLSDIASACAHLVLILFLIVFPHYQIVLIEQMLFDRICYTLFGLIVLSPIFSLILHCCSKQVDVRATSEKDNS